MPPPSREQAVADAAEEIAAYAFIRAWMADDVDKGMLMIEQHHVPPEAALFVMSLVKAASRALLSAEGYQVERPGGPGSVARERLREGRAMTAAQQEPGQLITAAGAFIRATITGDEWTAQRTAALVKDDPGGYLYFSFLVARVASALLVRACGSKAQAAALVNDWVNENVKVRVRKSA